MIGAGPLDFMGPPATVPIINYGHLETEVGGSVYLIAKQIENHGTIEAPGGTVGLVAGQEVLLSTRADGLGLSARVTLPSGTVDNSGRIIADAGHVLLQANTVNQSGLLQANSVQERNGTIELLANESIDLGSASRIKATGGDDANGGKVLLKAGAVIRDQPGSIVSAAGGSTKGNGGEIELSAPQIPNVASKMSAAGAAGFRSGALLIDPTDVSISNSGTGNAGNGSVGANDPPNTLDLNVNSAFAGFSQITIQATHNISLQQGTLWDLPSSTGLDSISCKLTLEAGNDIQFGVGSRLQGGNNWSISLIAGSGFTAGQSAIPGIGNVTLVGNATVEAGSGSIQVLAGNGVTLGTGAVRTVGGGNIAVRALSGTVNCGSSVNGFDFSTSEPAYSADPELGGVSTANGGSVFIQAGGDIRAYLPPANGLGSTGDAGTGAFGIQPGDVTLIAGGKVSGHFVVVNGTGIINAGTDAGNTSRLLALSLSKGSWTVTAGGAIYLQEVRDPNGVFNAESFDNPYQFLFDYDPAASVSLIAGNQVVLSGASLPRPVGAEQMLPIYPPSLSIQAGPGGVILGNRLALFPSPVGNLSIQTTSGGDLRSDATGQLRSLILSDSDKRQWTGQGDFTEGDRGNNVLHANDNQPVVIDVSGSISDVRLISPKPAEIKAAGDIVNCSLVAENLRDTDSTVLDAGGSIRDRNYYTFVKLTGTALPPDFDLINLLVDEMLNPDPNARGLLSRFVYDSATQTLGFGGRMSAEDRTTLLNLHIRNPIDLNGPPLPVTFVDPTAINELYTASQDVPTSPAAGFQVAGPGQFLIRGAAMDLGVSEGVISSGFGGNTALVPFTKRGAAIDISLGGDLDMYSSTIISEYGGDIRLQTGGSINIGLQSQLGASELPRGIVSLWQANIDIMAQGNIEVNGSRVAAYDGGNIQIVSESGNVDAGQGGNGFIRVSKPYFDVASGQIRYSSATIPGSGIIASSYPIDVPGELPSRVGNISVQTPHGDILASQGGIVQVALGSASGRDASISLQAGSTDPDGTVHVGKIVATGSGVIGGNVDLKATGDIEGVVVAQSDVSIASRQNVNVTAIGQGSINVSASGTVSGTVVGVGSVNVAGTSISANMVSSAVTASGNVNAPSSSAQAAAPAPSTAGQATTQSAQTMAQVDAARETGNGDSDKKTKPRLTRRVGRVTVILPKS
jgi:hypothetical protein